MFLMRLSSKEWMKYSLIVAARWVWVLDAVEYPGDEFRFGHVCDDAVTPVLMFAKPRGAIPTTVIQYIGISNAYCTWDIDDSRFRQMDEDPTKLLS